MENEIFTKKRVHFLEEAESRNSVSSPYLVLLSLTVKKAIIRSVPDSSLIGTLLIIYFHC